ncbi:MAG: hypothetical protein ABEH42_03150 [Haloarculaceae archaeon]
MYDQYLHMPAMVSRHHRTESLTKDGPIYRGEQVTLRNRDARTGYGLGIRIVRPDGEPAADRSVYLGADTTTRLFDVCEPGPVLLRVRHAGEQVDSVETRLGDSPDATARIECANGTVTATAGVP